MNCRVCKDPTAKSGLLYRCQSDACGAVHWDKTQILNLISEQPELKTDKQNETIDRLLTEACVPKWVRGESYVYIMRLRGALPLGTIGRQYVGMTNLHPYHRYLNHIRGYQASSVVKNKGTAMLRYEGPMTNEKAKLREPELAEELRREGYDVHGGH